MEYIKNREEEKLAERSILRRGKSSEGTLREQAEKEERRRRGVTKFEE